MTQPATNAQVALQAAAKVRTSGSRYIDATSVTLEFATEFLTWLNANTPPPADQPGELA